MPLRKLNLPLAFLILFGFVLSARADDANIQMTTANGTTVVGFQSSSGNDVATVTSAGGLEVSSNTILPGTTFYQDGAVVMGANQTVTISSNVVMPGTTHYQDGAVVFGAPGQSITFSTNTILPGATFYQDGAISIGTPALAIAVSSNVVISGGNATLFQNGFIAVSSATFRGFAQLTSLTNTTIHGITPVAVGELYYCSNCVAASGVCVSTGVTQGAFSEVESKTTACN
jgi:hypothetical protein